MSDEQPVRNTDRELWRETPGDYYSPSIHVTQDGGIGINFAGTVRVRTLREWHGSELRNAELAAECSDLRTQLAAAKARLAEIDEATKADADDLEKMRDGTKLTRAGCVQIIVYQRQDIDELKSQLVAAKVEGERLRGDNAYLRGAVEFVVSTVSWREYHYDRDEWAKHFDGMDGVCDSPIVRGEGGRELLAQLAAAQKTIAANKRAMQMALDNMIYQCDTSQNDMKVRDALTAALAETDGGA